MHRTWTTMALVLASLLLASATSAQTLLPLEPLQPFPPSPATMPWTPGPPDPNPGEPDHYRNNPDAPTQTRLEDCWMFDAQAWEQPLEDWRRAAAWMCKGIAQNHAAGRSLNDNDRAMESLLLAYEDQTRAAMIAVIADRAAFEEMIRQAKPDATPQRPQSIFLRAGWQNAWGDQDALAQSLGLIDVLNALR